MEVEKWLPIAISVIALIVSLGSLYLQHFRRVRKGSASVLWATLYRDAKKTSIKVGIDIAFSNQGNRPFVVSRVWLLSRMKDGNKRQYESEMLNQDNPLKVEAASIEYMHLKFEAPFQEFLTDLGHPMVATEAAIEALIYVTDYEGREYYSMAPVMRLFVEGDKIEGETPIKSTVNVLQKSKSKSQ